MKLKLKDIAAVVFSTILPIGLGVVVLVLVVAWMMGVMEKKIEPGQTEVATRRLAPGQEVNIYKVQEVSKDYVVEAVGTLKAASRTDISARVMAPIERILVRAGQLVTAGDVLVELDRRALEIQLSKTQRSLEAFEAALQLAESDHNRTTKLRNQRIIGQEEMEKSTEKLRVSRANLNRAREAVNEAQVVLSYTTIKAPRDGTIVDRLAEEGNMAKPGETLLTLYDQTSLRLEVPVMANLAVKLKLGTELTVRIDAVDQQVTARIDEIVPRADAASRSFLVKVTLPRSEKLFEGMFGRLIIPVGTRRHLCLNTDAIETIRQLQFVDVVADDNTLQRRMITTGRLGDENHREVLSGLKAGERVLLKPKPETEEP